jgi:peptide-methionine (S)-S-oxide reductase
MSAQLRTRLVLAAALLAAVIGGCERREAAAPASDANANSGGRTMETATFGAGCFWGVEAKFRQVEGVLHTAVGYMGGTLENPTYADVCTDRTGHAEVVQVTFDPADVSYDDLLAVFWRIHDPTQLNRQGPDVGTQYRSVIFYHTPEQEQAAQASEQALEASGRLGGRPVATAIEPAGTFWRAEEYHQRYLEKCSGGSCPL